MDDISDFRQERLDRELDATDKQEEQEEQEQHGMRATITMRKQQHIRKEIQRLKKEIQYWQEEAGANGKKKNTCIVMMVLALGDDVIDVIAALVSFGFLPTVTFPIPGFIRMIVAIHERQPRPDRMIRTVGAMILEAIPGLNLLPTTTANLSVDLVEAVYDEEHAKKEITKREQQIKKLGQSTHAVSRQAA